MEIESVAVMAQELETSASTAVSEREELEQEKRRLLDGTTTGPLWQPFYSPLSARMQAAAALFKKHLLQIPTFNAAPHFMQPPQKSIASRRPRRSAAPTRRVASSSTRSTLAGACAPARVSLLHCLLLPFVYRFRLAFSKGASHTRPCPHADDVLGMVFTKIDPSNPAREFSFNLRVRPDNTYAGASGSLPPVRLALILPPCNRHPPNPLYRIVPRLTVEDIRPALAGYEADLTLLNQSNNLSRFIQTMRRHFVELC
jgi:hypothetical protein